MKEGYNHQGHHSAHRDFSRFMVVGLLGLLINLCLLFVLYRTWGLPIFIAQLIASEVALFNNFVLHHYWTYKGHNSPKTIRRLIIEFHASSWVAIIGSATLVTTFKTLFSINYAVSLVIASLIAALWNFGWTRHYIWRHQHS